LHHRARGCIVKALVEALVVGTVPCSIRKLRISLRDASFCDALLVAHCEKRRRAAIVAFKIRRAVSVARQTHPIDRALISEVDALSCQENETVRYSGLGAPKFVFNNFNRVDTEIDVRN
jgi:hypothetical protein